MRGRWHFILFIITLQSRFISFRWLWTPWSQVPETIEKFHFRCRRLFFRYADIWLLGHFWCETKSGSLHLILFQVWQNRVRIKVSRGAMATLSSDQARYLLSCANVKPSTLTRCHLRPWALLTLPRIQLHLRLMLHTRMKFCQLQKQWVLLVAHVFQWPSWRYFFFEDNFTFLAGGEFGGNCSGF